MTEPRAPGQDSSMQVVEIVGLEAHPGPPLARVAEASFREIFDEHHTFVFRSLLHLGVPDAAADDAVQEVFVVVHRKLREYDPALPLRAWLWGIARHVASNQRRSFTRDQRLREALASEPIDVPDVSLERARELRLVRDILMAMEDPLRDVLALSDIEGMTAPEIATAIGSNVNTIYSRLRIARQRFAEALRRKRPARGGSDGE